MLGRPDSIGSMMPMPRNVLLYRLGGPVVPIVVPVRNGAFDLAFSPDGKLLATGSVDGTVTLSEVSPLSIKE